MTKTDRQALSKVKLDKTKDLKQDFGDTDEICLQNQVKNSDYCEFVWKYKGFQWDI